MKINKFLVFFLFIFIFSTFVFAEQQGLGVYKQNECVRFIQICSNCTYVNFTSVVSPDSVELLDNELSTSKRGTLFNVSFCETAKLGQYIVSGVGDINGIDTVFAYDFEITPTGKTMSNNLLPIISAFVFLIIFFSALGIYNKDSFGLSFASYGFAFIELIYLVGVLFVYESGGILIGLLKVNFYTMAIVGFGIGMYSLFIHSIKIAVPENDMDIIEPDNTKWGDKKW